MICYFMVKDKKLKKHMTILVNGEMAFDKNKNNSDKNTSAK